MELGDLCGVYNGAYVATMELCGHYEAYNDSEIEEVQDRRKSGWKALERLKM